MAFTQLIKKSKNRQKIPNPSDFNLDKVISNFFGFADSYDFLHEEIGSDPVKNYAFDHITKMETDNEIINHNQDILDYFKRREEKEEKRTFEFKWSNISQKNYKGVRELSDFEHQTNRVGQYVRMLSSIEELIKESSNKTIQSLRKDIQKTTNNKRTLIAKESLDEVISPGTLELKTRFKISGEPYEKLSFDEAELNYTYKSGNKETLTEIPRIKPEFPFPESTFPYEKLIDLALDKIEEENIPFSKAGKINLEVRIDEEKETVLVSLRNKYAFNNLLKNNKEKNIMITLSKEDLNKNIWGQENAYLRIKRRISEIEETKYHDIMNSFDKEISEIASTVCELRYLTAAASEIKQIKRRGAQMIRPILAKKEEKISAIEDMKNLAIFPNSGDYSKIIGNDVLSTADQNNFVITGTNNNGKTTYMDGIGINQAFGQAGLDIFATYAQISPVNTIRTHYVKPGDLENGESRYAYELSRIKELAKNINPYDLILMDEPCSGTSSNDGRKEAEVVFREFGKVGATMYLTTHFHNLIEAAEEIPYAHNLHCVVNKEGEDLEYTYKIADGGSHNSNGMYLAKKIGVDNDGLEKMFSFRSEREGFIMR